MAFDIELVEKADVINIWPQIQHLAENLQKRSRGRFWTADVLNQLVELPYFVWIVKEEDNKFAKLHGLSTIQSTRKTEIRRDQNLIKASNDARTITLKKVRDVFYNKLNVISNKKLKEYVLSDWLDATKTISPLYIKVTGHGNVYPYTASLENPLQNSKIETLHKSNLIVSKVGNDSVGVETINKRILKMRVKYESQAMASSVKFSGDPWQ